MNDPEVRFYSPNRGGVTVGVQLRQSHLMVRPGVDPLLDLRLCSFHSDLKKKDLYQLIFFDVKVVVIRIDEVWNFSSIWRNALQIETERVELRRGGNFP